MSKEKDSQEKRIYALNKIAYLLAHNIKPIAIRMDEETGYVYYVFPVCPQVYDIIKMYKNDRLISDFIKSYSDVVGTIKKMKRGELNGFCK